MVFRAAVDLGLALLPAEALHLGDGEALHAERRQRLAHVVELEGLDDGHDQLHVAAPSRLLSTSPRHRLRRAGRVQLPNQESCRERVEVDALVAMAGFVPVIARSLS